MDHPKNEQRTVNLFADEVMLKKLISHGYHDYDFYQKNNVGVLIESSGHTDPLSLTSTKINSLNDKAHQLEQVFILDFNVVFYKNVIFKQWTENGNKWLGCHPFSNFSLVPKRKEVNIWLK